MRSIERDEVQTRSTSTGVPAKVSGSRNGSLVKTSRSSRRSMGLWSMAPELSGWKLGPPLAGVGSRGTYVYSSVVYLSGARARARSRVVKNAS